MRTLLVLSASFFLAACSSTAELPEVHEDSSRPPVAESRPSQSPFPLFPPAKDELVLEWHAETGPPTVLQLLKRYAELTEQVLVFDPEYSSQTRTLFESQPVVLEKQMRVPAAEVQTFVESLLVGFALLRPGPTTVPRTVFVHSLKSPSRTTVRDSTIAVAADEIEMAGAHPAVLFTTLLELPNTDARILSNSLRSTIVDPNVHSIIPVGNRSMLVTAPGLKLVEQTEQLRAIDAAQGAPGPAKVYEFIRLRHAEAQQIGPLAKEAFPEATVRPYAPKNALLIICREQEWPELQRLVAKLDAE